MKKKKGFVTTGILFSLLILMVYLITSIVLYTVKIKYNKKTRVDKTNALLDDDNSGGEKTAIKDRVIYTREDY